MKERQRIAEAYPAFTHIARISAVGAIVACVACSMSSLSVAQQIGSSSGGGLPAFAPGMIDHMQAMRRFKDPDQSVQQAPPIIPKIRDR